MSLLYPTLVTIPRFTPVLLTAACKFPEFSLVDKIESITPVEYLSSYFRYMESWVNPKSERRLIHWAASLFCSNGEQTSRQTELARDVRFYPNVVTYDLKKSGFSPFRANLFHFEPKSDIPKH